MKEEKMEEKDERAQGKEKRVITEKANESCAVSQERRLHNLLCFLSNQDL